MLALLAALTALAQEAPVELPFPAGVDPTKPWKLIRLSDGKEVAAQIAGAGVVFLAKNEKSDYRLESGTPSSFPKVECIDDGKGLVVAVAGKNILRYNHAVIPQPDPVFSRSGYLHPVWTPAGRIITNDSPQNHLHHHGIWSAWTSSEFEGRKSNFWESAAKQGRIEHVKVDGIVSGPVFAGFKVRLRYLNLNGPDGDKPAVDEVWELRAYARTDRFVFDLESTQTCATSQPLVIKEYRYGGIGFRGSADWEGKTGVEFLTSEGKNRIEGHATKAKWCIAAGKVGGADASIGFLCHPMDFRFPQPMRIHPGEPFFNWAVPQGGDFAIEPGKPMVARYRFIVADGKMTSEDLDAAWNAYGEASKVTLR